jgi:hypothetical protein
MRVLQDAGDRLRCLIDGEAVWAPVAAMRHRGLPSLETLQATQADVAMAWLRNIRLLGTAASFTSVVQQVEPALQREEARASGVRKADLIAHLGYADFLHSRDGAGGLAPEARYREALALDPTNPFANAMLAHWLLWHGAKVPEVEPYFQRGLEAGRERGFVRQLQLSALLNRTSGYTDLPLVRVANEMRKGGEVVEQARPRPPGTHREPQGVVGRRAVGLRVLEPGASSAGRP